MGATGTTYLTGWTGYRYAGTSAAGTLSLVADNGTLNSGAVYNLGSSGSPDRALGMLASGSTIARMGAHFVNNTGVTITTINLAGVMEQWRSGSSNTANEVDAFAYSLDATDLAGTGTWTNVTAMDLVEKLTTTTTAAAVDGNQAANQSGISGTLTGLSWTNGSSMWIRWSDANDAGSDGDLSIDNLTMSFNIVLAPPGKGTASIVPALAQGGVNDTLTVVVHGESPYTLTNTNVVVPSIFTWSHSTGDISLTGGGSPSTSISGDTVKISGMTVTGTDSIQITINNIMPPDSTDSFVFHTQTGTQPDSILDLAAQPSVLVYGTPHSIGDLKANDVNGVPVYSGKYVTILGVVTVGGEFGSPSYIQDATGGIAVFGVITSGQIAIGDEVEIVGFISPFNGLTEVNSPTIIKKVSSGNVVVPIVVTCNQANFDGGGGVEQYEGRLVRINQVTVTTLAGGAVPNWTVGGSGTNYKLHDTDTLQVRVDNNVNFANAPAPQAPFDIIGVLSQFKNSSPFIGGYQLMPRSTADIISAGPIFASAPVESNLQPTSMRISWTTINNGTTRVRYGLTTAYELGIASPDNTLGLSHAVDLTGLTPATIYHVQAFSDDGVSDTSFAGDLVVSSASPPASAGQINVYFNKSVDNSVSLGENALGNQDLVSRINTRIDNAHRSIDIALYSLSAASYGDVIASHLVSAKNRGVSIRVICEADNQNAGGGSIPTLSSNGIPVINDKFDVVWNGAGLMHNKFFVFDARGGVPESVWVWGGSWNPTNSGTSQDRQNAVEIQDQALAGAYTAEFNQMWGSSTETPNSSNSRFGARKLDITPHHFLINGIPVESYFSPSDHTTTHITDMIAKTQHSISTCILTYTRKEIADGMIAKKTAGDKVRVVVDNNTDQGNQFSYLQGAGVDIHLKGGGSGLLHHKYTSIDGDQPTGPSYLETGSHNYSSSAENSNDENSLFFESKRIANLYLQEFVARYYEAGGTDSIHVTSAPDFSLSKTSIDFGTVDIGNAKQDSFVVTNPGSALLSISSVSSTNARYAVGPGSASIPPSGSLKFYVTFTPTAATSEAGSIVLVHNAATSPDTVALQGLGNSNLHPQFSASPSSLNFGAHPIGSSSVDSFTVSNAGTATLHMSNMSSTNPLFTVALSSDTVIASGSKVYKVTFAPVSPGPSSGNIVILHDAPGSPDTIALQGTAVDTPITMSISMLAGWNLISLPSYVSNGHRAIVYPTSISRAFIFQNTAYHDAPNDSLVPGNGAWLKFDTAQGVSVSGLRISALDIPVTGGWNLFGSLSSPVDAISIVSTPPNLVTGATYYGYSDTGYFATFTLEPGRAYWVNTLGAGSLHLTPAAAASAQKKGMQSAALRSFNTITLTDAKGRSRTLYFGDDQKTSINLEQFALPPTPPEGAFDVRFKSGRTVESYARQIGNVLRFPVLLQSQYYPISVEWSIDSKDTKGYTLTADEVAGSIVRTLGGKGRVSINDPLTTQILLAVSPDVPLPVVYSLDQNYPNPFNPSTTISFGIPRTAKVSLSVYTVLGELVRSLVAEAEYEPGRYAVSFDGSQLASGVYYYRMTAADVADEHVRYNDTKKFLLVK